MATKICRFLQVRGGGASLEYVLIVGLVAGAVFLAAQLLGTAITDALECATPCSGPSIGLVFN
jgi:Flp pilus assembly pilin Flp